VVPTASQQPSRGPCTQIQLVLLGRAGACMCPAALGREAVEGLSLSRVDVWGISGWPLLLLQALGPARVPKGRSPHSAQVTLVIPSGPGSAPAYVPATSPSDQNDARDSGAVELGAGLWLWASSSWLSGYGTRRLCEVGGPFLLSPWVAEHLFSAPRGGAGSLSVPSPRPWASTRPHLNGPGEPP